MYLLIHVDLFLAFVHLLGFPEQSGQNVLDARLSSSFRGTPSNMSSPSSSSIFLKSRLSLEVAQAGAEMFSCLAILADNLLYSSALHRELRVPLPFCEVFAAWDAPQPILDPGDL